MPNILIVSFDALRKDFVSVYNTEITMPDVFSRCGQSGVVFDAAMASGNWTVPSHASLFSGLEGQKHGVYNWRERIPLTTETIFDRAYNAGYRCAILSSEGVRKQLDNRTQIFEHFGDTYCGAHEKISSGDEPWCVFWHFLDTHAPYNMEAPRPADLDKVDWQVSDNTINWLRELVCTGQIDRITDKIRENISTVSTLVDNLWSQLGNNTVVALMSDHGEDFRRHMPFHCSFETSVLRIPMAISAPGLPASRSNMLIAHADLMELVWELATALTDQERSKRIARPTLSAKSNRISICGPDAFDNEEVFFAAATRDKLLVVQPSIGGEQRYLLNDIYRSRIAVGDSDTEFDELSKSAHNIVAEFFKNYGSPVDLSDSDVSLMLEQLEKLGYIS